MTNGDSLRGRPFVILAGAGVSMGAGIPHAAKMLEIIEDKFEPGEDWEDYRDVYSEIMVAIEDQLHALRNSHGVDVPDGPEDRAEFEYGAEHLVDWLLDREETDRVPSEKAGELRSLVRIEFGDMLDLKDPDCAAYFMVLLALQARLGRSIHLFTVNLDLCVETLHRPGFPVVTGFDGYGEGHCWDKDMFLPLEFSRGVYLYKFHGSVNWIVTDTGQLCLLDPGEPIDIAKAEIVLGRVPKRRGDFPEPYEFYADRFRELSRQAREVYVVGYGFGDVRINDMLRDFARGDSCDRLVVVSKFDDAEGRKKGEDEIRDVLKGGKNIRVCSIRAENLDRTIGRWVQFLM